MAYTQQADTAFLKDTSERVMALERATCPLPTPGHVDTPVRRARQDVLTRITSSPVVDTKKTEKNQLPLNRRAAADGAHSSSSRTMTQAAITARTRPQEHCVTCGTIRLGVFFVL